MGRGTARPVGALRGGGRAGMRVGGGMRAQAACGRGLASGGICVIGRGDCGRGLAGRRALGGGRGEEGRERLCGTRKGGAWFEILIFLLSASASRDGGGCGGR